VVKKKKAAQKTDVARRNVNIPRRKIAQDEKTVKEAAPLAGQCTVLLPGRHHRKNEGPEKEGIVSRYAIPNFRKGEVRGACSVQKREESLIGT